MMGLARSEKIRIALIYTALVVATISGFYASAMVGKLSVVMAGLGAVAYVLGLRHGVDADHIAAIDSTTRKLMQKGERPVSLGMWFSLGHSTVVIALIVTLVVATRAIVRSLPAIQSVGVLIGTAVSGTFLWVIGLINVGIAIGIYRTFRSLREGKLNQSELENLLDNRGFLNRFFRPLFRVVTKPWQIYPIGVLFGMGFDTASEIALIAVSVGVGVASSVPVWMMLVLPLMFTCGMVLVDTTDGVMMSLAYGWAFLAPIRKIYYNLTVTITSVLVAFTVGCVEVLQVLSGELGLSGPFWNWLGTIDFEMMGFGIVAIFATSWLVSMLYWNHKRYGETPFQSPGLR